MASDNSAQQSLAQIRIRGRVQGVYYRASMVQEAQKAGLTGWVRNCEDGDVEAVAEGSRAAIESLLAWCRQGPPGARVDSVNVNWQAAAGSFSGFTVKR
jgi:acylphosphatase